MVIRFLNSPLGDGGSFHNSPSRDGGSLYFLIGLMGSGKTYWAQRLAVMFQCDWIDLDQQIEKATDMTIREIFATEGEEFFRAKERDTLKQLSVVNKLVVACGGGTPCFHNNMQWMNENGTTIWLQPDVDELVARLKRGKYKRPLIANLDDAELKDFVLKKMDERKPFYSLAKHHIQGDNILLEKMTQLFQHA